MRTKVNKYKMGTDEVIDRMMGPGGIEGYTLYLVTGKWGEKPILIEKTEKEPRFKASQRYAEKYGMM